MIWTHTGQVVHYLDPSKTKVIAEDLQTHLGRIIRYGGARDVSVLEHLALCVTLAQRRKFDPLTLAYVAAHDLSEAYILDLPTPMKDVLPAYRELLEEPWDAHVHRAVGLEWPPPQDIATAVHDVDLRALVVEMFMTNNHGLQEVLKWNSPATQEERKGWYAWVGTRHTSWRTVHTALTPYWRNS